MILPKGTVIFENLASTMVNIDGLLGDLKKREFIGYIAAVADDMSGAIFLRDGLPVNAIEEIGSGRVTGESALNSIIQRCRTGSVTLNVSEVSEALLNALIGLSNSVKLYENLRSDFVSLDKLLATLEEQKHTGCLEIGTDSNVGLVLFEGGLPIDSIFSVTGGADITGIKGLDKIMDVSKQTNAIINVYQSDSSASEEGVVIADDSGQVLEVYGKVISGIEERINRITGVGRFKREFTSAMKSRRLDDLTYSENVLTYTGGMSQTELASALNDVLGETIRKVSGIIPKRTIESSIRAGLKSVVEEHREEIERFGIYDSIFGAKA